MKFVRKLFVGGNWKSNGTVGAVKDLVNKTLNTAVVDYSKLDVVVAPMMIHIPLVQGLIRNEIQVAAQNSSLTGPGAYTGEIPPELLRDLGLNWVILGHSERRSFYGEVDAVVGGKVKRALAAGLNVVACVGENLKERESGVTSDVIVRQLSAFKANVTDWNKVVLAYEPVWAIGTGVSASPAQAQDVHLLIRNWMKAQIGEKESKEIRIIYGGSVTDVNSGELIGQSDIDGFLVGGASLKPAFVRILESCKKGN